MGAAGDPPRRRRQLWFSHCSFASGPWCESHVKVSCFARPVSAQKLSPLGRRLEAGPMSAGNPDLGEEPTGWLPPDAAATGQSKCWKDFPLLHQMQMYANDMQRGAEQLGSSVLFLQTVPHSSLPGRALVTSSCAVPGVCAPRQCALKALT